MRTLMITLALLLVVAACGDDDSGRADTPSLEAFAAAPNCAALSDLMVQADDALFWNNDELTVDEVNQGGQVQTDESGPSFTEVNQAVADRQSELDCTDAEVLGALESAAAQRCEEWLDEGHSLDEDPLLLNTLFCVGSQG